MPQTQPFLDTPPDVAVGAIIRTAETSTAEHQAAIWILTFPGLPLARVWRVQQVRISDVLPGTAHLAIDIGDHLARLTRLAWSSTEEQLLQAARHLYTGAGTVALRGLNEAQLARVYGASKLANGIDRWHSGHSGMLVHDLATGASAHRTPVAG